jgi:hypothetical protein
MYNNNPRLILHYPEIQYLRIAVVNKSTVRQNVNGLKSHKFLNPRPPPHHINFLFISGFHVKFLA